MFAILIGKIAKNKEKAVEISITSKIKQTILIKVYSLRIG